jgi:hypothetical protein
LEVTEQAVQLEAAPDAVDRSDPMIRIGFCEGVQRESKLRREL